MFFSLKTDQLLTANVHRKQFTQALQILHKYACGVLGFLYVLEEGGSLDKNPAYGRPWISGRVRIVAPIQKQTLP